MSDEKEYEEPPRPDDPSDKDIFDEVMADTSAYGAFERSLGDAKTQSDPEDLVHAREGADHLRALLSVLCTNDPSASLNEHERKTLHHAQALASYGTEEIVSFLATSGSPRGKGEALDALAALIHASFYVGRCSTAAQEALVRAAAEERLKTARLGGTESGKTRASDAKLRNDHVLKAAQAIQQEKPSARVAAIATQIEDAWPSDIKSFKGDTAVSDLLYRLIKAGQLAKPLPKSSSK